MDQAYAHILCFGIKQIPGVVRDTYPGRKGTFTSGAETNASGAETVPPRGPIVKDSAPFLKKRFWIPKNFEKLQSFICCNLEITRNLWYNISSVGAGIPVGVYVLCHIFIRTAERQLSGSAGAFFVLPERLGIYV